VPALADLTDWMDQQSQPHVVWYVKRLSGNDTLANGTNQAGPYIPKDILFDIFPSINRTDTKNPDCWFDLRIDSHADCRKIRVIYYNNKYHDNPKSGRNEARFTNFGGAASPLLDPDSTGALVVFSFHRNSSGNASVCHTWVCDNEIEAELVEERIGPVEPGLGRVWSVDQKELDLLKKPTVRTSCWLDTPEIPSDWLKKFPNATEIIRKTIELRGDHGQPVDTRLMRRRDCEFEIFRSIEEAIELAAIKEGFSNVDDFIARAQTILQRRKSRSGRSLELQVREIFIEEKLREGNDFSHQPESEPGKKPDFLFPSQVAYQDASFPANRLRMLAVKTTCKDRWRQVIQEANRIEQKHLLTLQQGVSEGQFREMTEAGIQLVIPAQLTEAFPKAVQPHLQTLESFIGDIRILNIE